MFKQIDNNDKGSTYKGHKVGVARGERHTVNHSISTSQVRNTPMKNLLGPGKDTHTQDKYELDLRIHSLHRQKVASAKNCDTFKLWDLQNKEKFGFIPLQNQLLPEVDIPAEKNSNIWDEHMEAH